MSGAGGPDGKDPGRKVAVVDEVADGAVCEAEPGDVVKPVPVEEVNDGVASVAVAPTVAVETDHQVTERVLSLLSILAPGFYQGPFGAGAVNSRGVREGIDGANFKGFENLLGEEFLSDSEPELQYVAKFFDRFAEQMGLAGAEFFKHEACQEHFRHSLREFQDYLESKLEGIEDLKDKAVTFNEFSHNWRELVTTAAYYAFFVHYGATRSGEKDLEGRPRPYIYHPLRAACKVMGGRVWYLMEPEFAAEVAHDTREDVHKGMLAVLMADKRTLDEFAERSDGGFLKQFATEGKKKHKPQALALLDEMEAHLTGMAHYTNAKDLRVDELIRLLTKKGENRNRSFLHMLAGILEYDKEGRLFEAAVVLDILKACDRFDNSASDSPSSAFSQIKDETAYLFLARAIALRAWNEVDWWHDYLAKVDPAVRKKLASLIQAEERARQPKQAKPRGQERALAAKSTPVPPEETPSNEKVRNVSLKDEFTNEFHNAIRTAAGRELVQGRDYVLEFREIGLRYEDIDTATASATKGELAKTFRNYVIFYPLRTDRDLCQAAAEVFQQLCPKDLNKALLKSPYLTTDLGRRVVANRCGVSLVENGKSNKYGVVIWGIFKHQRDAVKNFHGDYHLGRFDLGNDDARSEARGNVETFYRRLAPEIAHLQKQYALVDRFEAGVRDEAKPEDVGGWVKFLLALAKLGKSLGEVVGAGDFHEQFLEKLKVGPLAPDDAERIRWFLDKQVLLLFMEKEERQVVVNGRKITGFVPPRVNEEQALCFLCPVPYLGRKVRKTKDGHFEIEPGPFRESLCHQQTAFMNAILGDYKNVLLSHELAAWRGDSVQQGKRGKR